MRGEFYQQLTNDLETARAEGLFKEERIITSAQQADITVADGSHVINFCANNYLGLANHPDLIAAAKAGMDSHGFGMASVRFICGTQDSHKELEQKLAAFLGMEDAILYSSCFDANGGLFETLLGAEDAIISDALNHASIIDGVRLCKAKRYRYANNDMQELEARLKEAREYAVQQNINILRNRVNQLGVAEPLVQRQGADRIVVELPGIQDTARAKEILGATATLEFRLVNANVDQSAAAAGRIPGDSEVKQTREGQPVVLYKRVILTGDHITDSTSSQDEYNQPQVNISLDSAGGNIMSNFTKDNIGKPMATLFVEYKDSGKKDANGRAVLVKEEEVINIANIQSRLGNSFRITGISNPTEARQLSLLLRAGALIAPIQIVEERTIGPTLGMQNIQQGLEACLAGLVVSILFMIFFYKKFGLIATSALIANLVLIIGIMSLLPGATLTMPGIAGIVLTLAVAVDANVLINERIKEELSNGRSIQQAIDEGYKGAFSSIFDANVTTLIKVLILYAVGTGAIKGFAITTGIGVATSMFTAIVGTRAIVNLLYGGKRVKKLSI